MVPPWLGLSLAALYLAAVAGVWAAAIHTQRQQLFEQHITDGARWVETLARNVEQEDQAPALQHALRRTAREEGVRYAAIVTPAGTAMMHSDATVTGHVMPEVSWRGSDPAPVRVGTSGLAEGGVILATRVRLSDPVQSAAELWVALDPPRLPWTQSDLILWSGYVVISVMGLYLLIYRLFRRSVQPLDVIRKRLIGCREPVVERILALRLNDSFDQISTSWNQLIEFVAETQEQLRKSKLAADVTGAMDGYRSERLTGILMQIPFGVLVVEDTGQVSFANRAAAGLLGTGDALEGAEIAQLLEEPLRLSLLSGTEGGRSASGGGRWTDHTFKRPHGEVTLRFWSSPGEAGEHIIFAQDITQAKEAERARDQFLYHVTHELRTPLTNIRAYAETLSEGVIDDPQTIRECYNVIMGETQRLNRLVEDILNVSQLEVGTARLDVGHVDFERLLRTVVQDTQGKADARNIDLVLNLPAKMPRVRGDKERLAVVLTNLVGNAIKYTPEGGRVDVRCAAESGRVRVTVTDTGIGIKPEDQEKIFEKFYRVNDDRVSAIPGTGLGLAIVKETVRLHGGAVFVESTPGQGSTFTVTLPALDLDESSNARRPQAAVAAGEAH